MSGSNPGILTNWLFGVTTVANDDAWAVGSYWGLGSGQTLTLHLEGGIWNHVPSPNGEDNNVLYGVEAVTSTDVWTVGYYGPPRQEHMLILHWDGKSWAQVAAPVTNSVDYLFDVEAISSEDVWAVGYSDTSDGSTTLIVHWDGIRWSVVPGPNSNKHNHLTSIAAVSAKDIWAVGGTLSPSNVLEIVILHWNGSEWTQTPSPNPGDFFNVLQSVASILPDDVWAVGYYGLNSSSTSTLILHWDGISWQITPSPNIDTYDNHLYGVAPISPNSIWAVGAYGTAAGQEERVLTLHWDGSQWRVESNPNVGTQQNRLYDVAVTPGGELWAVGYLSNPGIPGAVRTLLERHIDPCTPCTITFSDVLPTDYYLEGVQYLYCRSIISGYSDNTFRPYNNTTRGQLSKIVVLAENWPIYIPAGPTFSACATGEPILYICRDCPPPRGSLRVQR